MKLSEITGHEEVKLRLRGMVQNKRIPHALLMNGAEGSGNPTQPAIAATQARPKGYRRSWR